MTPPQSMTENEAIPKSYVGDEIQGKRIQDLVREISISSHLSQLSRAQRATLRCLLDDLVEAEMRAEAVIAGRTLEERGLLERAMKIVHWFRYYADGLL